MTGRPKFFKREKKDGVGLARSRSHTHTHDINHIKDGGGGCSDKSFSYIMRCFFRVCVSVLKKLGGEKKKVGIKGIMIQGSV